MCRRGTERPELATASPVIEALAVDFRGEEDDDSHGFSCHGVGDRGRGED